MPETTSASTQILQFTFSCFGPLLIGHKGYIIFALNLVAFYRHFGEDNSVLNFKQDPLRANRRTETELTKVDWKAEVVGISPQLYLKISPLENLKI